MLFTIDAIKVKILWPSVLILRTAFYLDNRWIDAIINYYKKDIIFLFFKRKIDILELDSLICEHYYVIIIFIYEPVIKPITQCNITSILEKDLFKYFKFTKKTKVNKYAGDIYCVLAAEATVLRVSSICLLDAPRQKSRTKVLIAILNKKNLLICHI